MLSTAIKRLGELKVDGYVEGINNNWLIYKPLPNSRMHSSGIDGDVILSATPTKEVVDVDLDLSLDGYLYAFSIGNDNRLKVAYSKDTYASKAEAIDAMKCISVIYEEGNLTPNGNLFILTVRNSMGVEIYRSTPQTLTNIVTVMSTFNDTSATDFSGSLEYVTTPDYIVG